jgi:hypothetical protein
MNREQLRRLCRWMAMLLLFAQFGAELHMASHAAADPSDRMGQARTCTTCLASSQLQNAVAPPMAEIPARAIFWSIVVAEAIAPATSSAPFRAYRSRAPPVLI